MRDHSLSTKEAADFLEIHVQSVRRFEAEGRIKAKREHRPVLRFLRSDLEAFKATYQKNKGRGWPRGRKRKVLNV